MKKIIILVLVCIVINTLCVAQGSNVSKKQFDELWSKADSSIKNAVKTGSATKDLNALERDKIESVDIKDKPNFNPNGKGIDTSNLEDFSTQPIVKGSKIVEKPNQVKIILPAKTTVKKVDVANEEMKPIVKEVDIVKEPVKTVVKKTEVVKESIKPIIKEEIKVEKKMEKPVIKIEESKTIIKINVEDFSTQPIVKGKSTQVEIAKPIIETKKSKLDTTKNFKDFTFETQPIVGNNASYNRRNEPLPKTKEQIDDQIPVNRKSNNTNVNSMNINVKDAYAQYDKEADSLHTANKRRLDSIMKSLNISVPIVINPNDFIDIYVKGGGVILNSNSKLSDNISILHTGLLQREYNTKNDGVQRAEKKISKDELTKLAQYIVDMGFFDFNEDYDCADEDAACNARLTKSPQPVPLQISLIVGARKNKVNIAFYAPSTEKNWVNYPTNLDKIMNAIYTVVEK